MVSSSGELMSCMRNSMSMDTARIFEMMLRMNFLANPSWQTWQMAKIQYKPSRQLVQRIRIFLQVILRFRTEAGDAGGHKNVTMFVSGAFWLLEMLSFMPGIR